MPADYQGTQLWATAFGNASVRTEVEKNARDELLINYRKLEEKIKPLLESIPSSCRGLTIHDISHAHQLWSVADEICGPAYPLNPLEGLVLGAAFLIHDAGLTAAAYPGDIESIQKTKFFHDRLAALLRREYSEAPSQEALDNPPAHLAERALFDSLRAIHAKRAENLLEIAKPHPLTGEPYPLFPDADLFLDCGEVIGLIAASHHWPISQVDERFGQPLTPPAAFTGWSIDAVKLTCILRAADACAIDERRARIMHFILADPRGVSRDHWAFQAYLKPGARRDEAVVFESKRPFPQGDMPAWWTAYDALGVADRELRDCDRLLRARSVSGRHASLKSFEVRRVDGAGDPKRLQSLLRVSGWTPVDTAVRIENPLALVEALGGWQLYGDDYSAPLRELIQNASDTVRARRTRPNGYDNGIFPGRIDITVESKEVGSQIEELAIVVADDGVGIDADVLTVALIDFGRSFWSTEQAAVKHPGLLSDPDFEPTGRFGIGFYSAFMIANEVKVVSRSWDAGPRDARVLHFRNGVAGRAELRGHDEAQDSSLSGSYSTVVRLKLSNLGWLGYFAGLSMDSFQDQDDEDTQLFWEQVEKSFRQLVFALDVRCSLCINNGSAKTLNDPGVLNSRADAFVRAYNETFASLGRAGSFIQPEEVNLIDGIANSRGRYHTRGLVDTSGGFNAIHVGGFHVFRRSDGPIKGVVSYEPGTAARVGGRRSTSKRALAEWGSEQLRRIEKSVLPLEARLRAVASLADFGVDVSNSALIRSDSQIVPIRDLVDSFPDRVVVFLAVQRRFIAYGPWRLSNSNFHSLRELELSDLADLKHTYRLYGSGARSEVYDSVEGGFDMPTNPNSAYSILMCLLHSAGYKVTVNQPSTVVLGTYCGPEGGRGRLLDRELVPGMKVDERGVVVTARRLAV